MDKIAEENARRISVRRAALIEAIREFPDDPILSAWQNAGDELSPYKVTPGSVSRRVAELRNIIELRASAAGIMAQYAADVDVLRPQIASYEAVIDLPEKPAILENNSSYELSDRVRRAEEAVTRAGNVWHENASDYTPESDDGYRPGGWTRGAYRFHPERVAPELFEAREAARAELQAYDTAYEVYRNAVKAAHTTAANASGVCGINDVRRRLKIAEAARIGQDGCVYLPTEESSGYPTMHRVTPDDLYPGIPIIDWGVVDSFESEE